MTRKISNKPISWKRPHPLGAMYRDMKRRAETAEAERDALQQRVAELEATAARHHEQWRVRQADRTQIKLAELAHAGTMPAPNGSMPASSGHTCETCEREFATVQALNAHKRFCADVA